MIYLVQIIFSILISIFSIVKIAVVEEPGVARVQSHTDIQERTDYSIEEGKKSTDVLVHTKVKKATENIVEEIIHKRETSNSIEELESKEEITIDEEVQESNVIIEEQEIELEEETEEVMIESTEEVLVNISHSTFDALLKRFVSKSGVVDYTGLKSSVHELDRYLNLLETNPVQSSWSRNARLAYWINAYNAFTLKLIVDNYPLKSITDLHGGKPWDRKWIKLGDQTYSLNQIENKIIRPRFNDARIHFAVNCAAKSCPPLANTAFTESNVNSLLERRTVEFINDDKFTSVSAKGISVSKIFEWYAEDFGSIYDYIAKYRKSGLPKASINYMEYDWSLNGR